MESVPRDPSHPNPTAEEEAIKRNTDCIYFLASPLTCKKGSECEYRHSEGARMNPRDCWYWLNGNCTNPKCSFRHLPFEGVPGTPGATAGSSLPPSQATASSQIPAMHTPIPAMHTQIPAMHTVAKQAVSCIYFQKGHCLKGDRCPFMHGSQPVGNSALQQTPKPAASVTEPALILQKVSATLEKCTSQLKVPQINSTKPVSVLPAAKLAAYAEIVPNNGITVKRNMDAAPLYEEFSRPRPSNAPVTSGGAASKPLSRQIQPLDELCQNGREAGEFLGESSPGFDVLVDDEVENSDYYHPEDEYGRTAVTAKRHLNSANEFDYDRSAERGSLAKFDREPYNDLRDYDRHGRAYDRLSWEHRRTSPEKVFERSAMTEKRGLPREESPDRIDKSDLRYRLSKQRRVDGRLAISPDCHSWSHRREDRHVEEQSRSRRDQRHHPPNTSVSSRLQGRIKLPGRYSPDNTNDSRFDRETDRGRNWGRSSPGRPISYQGRHHDKIRRTQEDVSTEARNVIGSHLMKRDDSDTLNFAGPKSLAELKGAKTSESSEGRLTNSRDIAFKTQLVSEQTTVKPGKAGHPESDVSLLFEGPKPLSVILKRKREVETGSSSKGSSDGDDNSQGERADPVGSSAAAVTEGPTAQAIESRKDDRAHSSYEEPRVTANTLKTVEGEGCNDKGPIVAKGTELGYQGQSFGQKEETLETEDTTMIETMEDQEPETFEQRDVEYDYEVNYENPDLEDEYLDDDDGDDFSRRIGAMLS